MELITELAKKKSWKSCCFRNVWDKGCSDRQNHPDTCPEAYQEATLDIKWNPHHHKGGVTMLFLNCE